MANQLKGLRALVTGGTRGIGTAIACQLLNEGASVIVTGTSSSSKAPKGTKLIPINFENKTATQKFATQVEKLKINILINNAGINKIAPFDKISSSDFERIQYVNVHAPFILCRSVLRHMRSQSWGRIVNISSIFGVISKAQRGSYSTSKFGLNGLTTALAVEVASEGILANCVSPGFVDTDLTRRILSKVERAKISAEIPIGRQAQADEIAKLVIWLASPENTYLTGQNLIIDGGFTRV